MRLCGHIEFDYTCEDCVLGEPHFDTSPEQDAYQEIHWLDEDKVIVELGDKDAPF